MIIKTLVENTSISEEFTSEHGLCLYIETKKHKLMFDLGASALFVKNAKKMDVDLAAVDVVILSHGHYDHGGGLRAFLHENSKAKIYLNQKAFDKHYSFRSGGKAYIGLDEELALNDRLIFVGDHLAIDEELLLFSNVKGNKLTSSGNKDLFMESGSSLVEDDFSHEQNLIIIEDGNTVLLAGCAHNGIVNIIDHLNTVKNCSPSHVIGGFHLYSRPRGKYEDTILINQIGEYLSNTGSKYYTCHCTGIEPYKILKDTMKEQITYLATGSQVII
jgi:7,8-dihydropterin-6-yl-methyl-4-(beta-D-ribofuranosyl)aminobenzene 5'-phosphate synthase